MGRFSGLAEAMSVVADKLKADREQGQKQNLLGVEGLIKGNITPTKEEGEGTFSIPRMGRVKQVVEAKEWKPQTQEEALGFEGAKAGLKKGLTLSNALGILSDPMKAYQLKKTYPNLYKEAEDVVKANLGEDVLTGMTTPKLPGKVKSKLPTKIIPDLPEENIMDTNW